jgi:nickel/cobalt exporter
MNAETTVLGATALSVGFFHTLLGPEHYLPFVALSRAAGWTRRQLLVVTLACGVGHVASSALLGLLGILLGTGLTNLTNLESRRGDLAGWLLLGFGLAYLVWGLRTAARDRPHHHLHVHADGTVHAHEHTHDHAHAHVHVETTVTGRDAIRPWALFTIFVFGPCEPLIPILMYPAAEGQFSTVVWVTLLFGAVTIATMIGMVLLLHIGVGAVSWKRLERYSHALAGFAILACGVAIKCGL